MEVFREFTFDAAHRLEGLPEGHKCAAVHGHTYRLVVYVGGEVDERIGWIVDFAEVKRHVGDVISVLDHAMLNEVEGLGSPTTEGIARWIWPRVKERLPGLSRIVLWEGARNGVTYSGECDGVSGA